MLVVRRLVGGNVKIGEGGSAIVVTVVKVKGNEVTIGIDAPKDVPILRDDAVNKTPKEVGR